MNPLTRPPAHERTATAGEDVEFRHAVTDAELRACWPVMQLLRPHLRDADELVARVDRMRGAGYRLLAAWRDGEVVSLGGYRLQENLVHGRFLYVDDLVTCIEARGAGWGARMLAALQRIAREAGCERFVLDTAVTNTGGQRFYAREGLGHTALRFTKTL